jgi:hypothetical protein
VSSDTSAQPSATAGNAGSDQTGDANAPVPEIPKQHTQTATMRGRHEPPRDRSGRVWTWVTAAAAVAFCVALVLGAMRLYVGVNDVTDTPEHTVDAFLEALLDQRDAEAAAAWLCADKADSDLSEAVAALSFTDGPGEFKWSAVTETGRSVGAATVEADIHIGDGGAFAEPTTWEFSLVAEEGEPQWLICGITAE